MVTTVTSPFACMCIPEQRILGEMMKTVVERGTGLDLAGRVGLDGHEINHQAMLDGRLWMYAEYTGTALRRYLKGAAGTNPDQVYQIVRRDSMKRWNLVWLPPFGFNNTYALLMRASGAPNLGIKRISQVAGYGRRFTLAASKEFLKGDPELRFAVGGYSRFTATYGFEFGNTLAVDSDAAFSLLEGGDADVAVGFATDFRVVRYDLIDLQDDRQFFSPYEMAPVLRGDFLTQHPTASALLRRLAGKIENLTMARLNFQLVAEQRQPKEVAQAFLANMGLVAGPPEDRASAASPSEEAKQP